MLYISVKNMKLCKTWSVLSHEDDIGVQIYLSLYEVHLWILGEYPEDKNFMKMFEVNHYWNANDFHMWQRIKEQYNQGRIIWTSLLESTKKWHNFVLQTIYISFLLIF